MASDCASGLGLTANQPGTYNNIETALTEAEAIAQAISDIADIGYTLVTPEITSVLALLVGSTAIPILPIISLGIELFELVSLFSGRPKDQDTDNVIGAYNDSAYWPLHALAADLAEMLKNGAPISDSRSQIQAQFSQLKQGTIDSIQGYAGWPPGPSSPGYWQLQRFINASWALSGQGQPAVLTMVKLIDRFTEILACLKQQQQSTGTGGGTGGGGGGGTGTPTSPVSLCQSSNPDTDEIVDSCIATQTSLQQIVAAIQALGSTTPGGEVDACCTAVVNAIASVAAALGNITALLAAPASPATPIDLSSIVAAVQELVAAVAAYPPVWQACCAALAEQLSAIAAAVKESTGTDVSGIVTALQNANTMNDVPQAIIDALVATGLVSAANAQLAGGGPFQWIYTLLHDEWLKLNHPATPDEVNAATSDPVFGPTVAAKLAGVSLPPFKEVLRMLPSVISGAIAAVIKLAMESAFVVGQSVMTQPINAMLNVHKNAIAGMVNVQPGDETAAATTLLVEAMTFGMGAHWSAMIGELVDPSKHIGLMSIAAMLAEFAGFKELVAGIIGVEVRQAISIPHSYTINAQARALMPNQGAALALMARRKITKAQAEQLLGYAGLNLNWVAPMEAGAYRAAQPRTLVQAFLDQPIDQTQLTAMLQDSALSDTNVTFMAQAITYKSISNVRQAYLSQLITGYGKGVVGDAELQQAMTDFNFSPQAQQYVMSHVLILRREVLAAETEKQIVPQIVNGLITPAAAQQQLEIAGVQPWYAELITGLAAVRAEIAVTKKELKAEEKLQAKQQLALQRTALADFANGSINAEALGAALIAAGLDPVVAAAVVAEKSATQLGRLKLVYGQLLTPADAKLQTERVDAVKSQLKEQLITYQQALAQLKSFGVTDADANAIVANVAAAIAAASTVGTLLNPLTGLPG